MVTVVRILSDDDRSDLSATPVTVTVSFAPVAEFVKVTRP